MRGASGGQAIDRSHDRGAVEAKMAGEIADASGLAELLDPVRHERVIWNVTRTGPDGEIATFETTDDHPWWIAGQGWKRTDELVAGMAVVTRDGRGMVLVSVAETDRIDATYNLTVADFETYFVGLQRVLVHNCNIRENAAKGAAGEAATRAKLGDSVAGEQVTFKTSDGTRTRSDFVTTDKGVVEAKTGRSPLRTGQKKLSDDIKAGRPVTPVGRNAERAGLTPNKPTRMSSCHPVILSSCHPVIMSSCHPVILSY